MNIDPDDPRLTAYALGELDSAEAAAVERMIEQSPECRAAVDEIRQMAALVSTELAGEPALISERTPVEVVAERAQTPSRPVVTRVDFRRWLVWGSLATAACFLVILQLPERVAVRDLSGPDDRMPQADRAGDAAQPNVHAPAAPAESRANKLENSASAQPVDTTVQAPQPASRFTEVQDAQLLLEEGKLRGVVKREPVNEAALNKAPEQRSETRQREIRSLDALTVEQTGRAPAKPATAPSPGASPTPASGPSIDPYQPMDPRMKERYFPHLRGGAEGITGGALADSGIPARPASGPADRYASSPPPQQPLSEERLPQPERKVASSDDDAARQRRLREELDRRNWGYRYPQPVQQSTAAYPHYVENRFQSALQEPLSTFSIDVDTASYANVRRFLSQGRLPPRDAVRIEELINYFVYDYEEPKAGGAFGASIEVAGCPWNSEHRLVRIGIKGRDLPRGKRPASNFVFLVDVSGSMAPAERLPLIKQALRQLVKNMTASDRVAMVTYASSSGIVLDSTSCEQKETVLAAIDRLESGGSTNGGEGIQSAYRVASENFIEGGVNRVILCTDGDFNVGITDQRDLIRLIEGKAKSGVFLTTLGVGDDNYKDALMQKLADRGNGNYHYLDSIEEAHKVLVQQMNANLVTIAKDVKIQIEFNPAHVNAYRLIGYEKRMLATPDFNDDRKDAGEIGAGHTVTALYEIVPAGRELEPVSTELKYQKPPLTRERRIGPRLSGPAEELLTLKLRYKEPDGTESRLLEFPVSDRGATFDRASSDLRFAAAVAAFGMVLRESEFKGDATFESVARIAEQSKGSDANGLRSEFVHLVRKAQSLRR